MKGLLVTFALAVYGGALIVLGDNLRGENDKKVSEAHLLSSLIQMLKGRVLLGK